MNALDALDKANLGLSDALASTAEATREFAAKQRLQYAQITELEQKTLALINELEAIIRKELEEIKS